MPEETEVKEESLNTPPDGGEETPPETEETVDPQKSGGEPETQEAKEPEKTEKMVAYEDHQKLQARLAYAERELRRKEREVEPPKVETPPTKTQPGEPNVSDFEDYNDYIGALTDWKTDQKFKAYEDSQRQQTEQEKQNSRQQKLDGIVAAEIAKDPDFLKKAYIPVGAVENLIVDSDQVVDLALYFGQNPGEAQKIAHMPVIEAAREIGRIEAKISTQIPQKTKTKAPTPTKTVGGNEVVEKSLEDMTTAEFIAYRNKQEFGG